MNRQSLVIVAAASIVAMASSSVMAKDGQRRGGAKIFKQADLDKDGKLSLEEVVAQATHRLGPADTNKDGEISPQELAAVAKKRNSERRAKRMMARLDYNGDGKVTLAELEDQARKQFALMDGNQDGFVEKAELRKAFFMMRGGKKRRGGDGGSGDNL